MKCSDEIIEYMHEYLDHEISRDHEQVLRRHLQECKDCQFHFHELKKAVLFIKDTTNLSAPSGFTENVMSKLPKEKRKVGLKRWTRNHPLFVSASLFLILMGGTVFSTWKEDYQFSFSKQPELIVENGTVIVPEGETVKGDVFVRNGDIQIDGKVEGNVTVINGEQYMASAGQVSGDIEEVDRVFEWLWYKIKTGAASIQDFFTEDSED